KKRIQYIPLRRAKEAARLTLKWSQRQNFIAIMPPCYKSSGRARVTEQAAPESPEPVATPLRHKRPDVAPEKAPAKQKATQATSWRIRGRRCRAWRVLDCGPAFSGFSLCVFGPWLSSSRGPHKAG